MSRNKIKYSFIILAILSIQLIFRSAFGEEPKGIYSYGLGRNYINSPSLQLPYIAGMTAAFTWQELEPKENQYDFNGIIELLDWAKKNDKLLNIVLVAGNKSPEWLYSKDINSITWKRRWKEDQAKMHNEEFNTEKSPVFWDDKYLVLWKDLITALSEKIAQHSALGYIVITGATPKDYTTGTVIRYDEDWNKIIELGYTHELHLKAWKSLIDHYIEVFKDNDLVLAVGPLRPASADLRLSEELIAYIVEHKWLNVSFVSVILNDTWFTTSKTCIRLRNLLKDASSHGHFFGYQMNYSVQRMNGFKNDSNKIIKDFDRCLAIAIEDGVSWIEVWHPDVIQPKSTGIANPTFKEAIEKATTKRSTQN
ncbi:MAG: hypothetical protein HC819_16720 [Cyclobacteriaceae bacterium]|nr:hypothetical protein [Cyclobacteriaceae bacterium]